MKAILIIYSWSFMLEIKACMIIRSFHAVEKPISSLVVCHSEAGTAGIMLFIKWVVCDMLLH